MKKNTKKDLHQGVQILVRAATEEKAILEAAAVAERRTLSNYLVTAGLDRAKKNRHNT